MYVNTRKIAVDVLIKIHTGDIPSQTILDQSFYEHRLKANDRALVTETVYGVLRNQLLLDSMIDTIIPVDQIRKDLMYYLRVGTYQLKFLDKVPVYAVLNEVVGALGSKKDRGFLNALLRKISVGNILQPKISDFKNLNEYLAIKYSHPVWLVDVFLSEFSKEKTIDILKANNKEPQASIRVNKLKIGRNQLQEKLRAKDIEVTKTLYSPDGLIIHRKSVLLNKLDIYTGGGCDIQKESSQLVSLIVNPEEHERILDACAGSGGKTFHMSALMKNTGEITALDKNKYSLERLHKNEARLGVTNIKVIHGDFLNFESHIPYDRVLVDAPCSGLGTISRNPEVRFRKTKEDIDKLAELQCKLLTRAASVVKKNGKLIYSVCTLTHEETKGVIDRFLSTHKDFHVTHISHKFIPNNSNYSEGKLLIFPNEAMEGFFITLMEKQK